MGKKTRRNRASASERKIQKEKEEEAKIRKQHQWVETEFRNLEEPILKEWKDHLAFIQTNGTEVANDLETKRKVRGLTYVSRGRPELMQRLDGSWTAWGNYNRNRTKEQTRLEPPEPPNPVDEIENRIFSRHEAELRRLYRQAMPNLSTSEISVTGVEAGGSAGSNDGQPSAQLTKDEVDEVTEMTREIGRMDLTKQSKVEQEGEVAEGSTIENATPPSDSDDIQKSRRYAIGQPIQPIQGFANSTGVISMLPKEGHPYYRVYYTEDDTEGDIHEDQIGKYVTEHLDTKWKPGDREENEDIIFSAFTGCYVFGKARPKQPKQWLHQGNGQVYILHRRENFRARVLLRHTKTTEILMNHVADPRVILEPDVGSDRAVILKSFLEHYTYGFKFELLTSAKGFRACFQDSQNQTLQVYREDKLRCLLKGEITAEEKARFDKGRRRGACSYCKKETNLYLCGGMCYGESAHCSKRCQKKHWKSDHRKNCKRISFLDTMAAALK